MATECPKTATDRVRSGVSKRLLVGDRGGRGFAVSTAGALRRSYDTPSPVFAEVARFGGDDAVDDVGVSEFGGELDAAVESGRMVL